MPISREEPSVEELVTELARLRKRMDGLAVSLAHEISQPLAAIVANGNACVRWLNREVPDLEEARASAQRIIRDALRANEIIRCIRPSADDTQS